MQAAHTICTYAPSYHQRCWLLNWTLMTRWKVSLLFNPEDTASVISNKNVKFGPRLTIETLFHFETVHFKWALAHRHRGRFWTMSHMASFMHDKALVGICRWHGRLCYWQWFWKHYWAHLVMSMTESCRWVCSVVWGPRNTASNKGLRHCPLRTEISPVSLNLLMMLCTVDDEICKAFAIWHWGTLFLKYSTSFYALFHRSESLCPSLLLRDSTSLRHLFYS